MEHQPQHQPTVDSADARQHPPELKTRARREKTWGERVFDISAYGGFGIVLNEILGWAFTGLIEKEPYKKPFGALRNMTEKLPVFGKFNYVTSGRLSYILVAFLGGTIAVLPVLAAEHVKGPIVRWLDGLRYGKDKVASDPHMVQVHKEMDEAPPQTLGSIIDGRVVTMASAIAIDSTFGGPDALSSQFIEKTRFKNTWVNKFSSMERACVTGARAVMNLFDPKGAPARLAAQLPEQPFKIQPGEGKVSDWLGRGGSLMTLSTVLTIIFYVSSKFFAKRIATNKEHKQELLNANAAAPQNAPDASNRSATELPDGELQQKPSQATGFVAREQLVRERGHDHHLQAVGRV